MFDNPDDGSGPADDGGTYEKPVRVDGDAYIEVGVPDPDAESEGYHTERIPFDEETDRDELRERVRSARDELERHVAQQEDQGDDWFDEIAADYES